ncbi:hypothetical protein N802_13870 [Knoellia sinensis KCTC 19936]|uniref:ATP-grasp domain-containing protein n=1 Tax=Knoellia sinensis KCTC 19936 TaxID=1385520 RepID=A0A0A0J7M7_9MICO|nr:peptide ligase PGM1-related protein [Knoellia sinensis]KGN33395.1 hypothetical protein N802_13870 [Knoellia sinensis KCTC 19936]
MGRFEDLQKHLLAAWRANAMGSTDEHVVVLLPSFSLGPTILEHYRDRLGSLEHRYLLAGLMLGTIPGAELLLVTCVDPGDDVLDYYAALAGPHDPASVRRRLHVVVVPDISARGISAKLLDRPDLLRQIRGQVAGRPALLEAWNVTDDEVAVAISLGVPVYGTAPNLWPLGFKSSGRRLLQAAGVPVPCGCEEVHGPSDVAAAIASIRRLRPRLDDVVVKQDNSGAGDGNLIVHTRRDGIRIPTRRLGIECLSEAPEWFARDLLEGGVVEELVHGSRLTSPSAQIDIGPDRSVRVLSTHEQVLGGENGQVFTGCRFPANPAYAAVLAGHARAVGHLLADRGVLGRVAVDFVAVRRRGAWEVFALEINLRRGGTTHPYTALRHLVPGLYDEVGGRWIARDGSTRCYRADDNVMPQGALGLRASVAVAAVEEAGLAFDRAVGTGVVLHMLSGLAVDGRLGVVAIGRTPSESDELHAAACRALALVSEPAAR